MQTLYTCRHNPDNSAIMRLYGSIGTEIDGNRFALELAALDGTCNLIKIRINSSGGDVLQGMSIVSAMISINTPIHIYIDGIAASMSAVIAVCGNKIHMQDFAKLMIHDPYFSGGCPGDDRREKALNRIRDMLCRVLSRRGKSEAEVARLMSEETWFSADEALRNRLCDEIIPSADPGMKALAPGQIIARINSEYKLFADMKKESNIPEASDLREQLIVLLGLKPEAGDTDILEAVTRLQQQAETDGNYLSEAYRMGYIDKSQATFFYDLDEPKRERLRAFIEDKRIESERQSGAMIMQAIRAGKFNNDHREVFDRIGKEMGASVLRNLLDAIPIRTSIASMIQRKAENDRTAWGLNEYRKNAPQELKNNPALYTRLLEEQHEKATRKENTNK